jgi:hypothetical protein
VHRSRGELIDEPLGGGLVLDLGEQLHGEKIPAGAANDIGHSDEPRVIPENELG